MPGEGERLSQRFQITPAALGGSVGNVIEWYDFALFGYFSSTIADLFFPGSSSSSLLATFAVFAAGFTMRPVGAGVFGYIGDRIGRRPALFLSVILMAIPTAALGLLPTYGSIGVAAPILLVVIRLVQGFSVGGEFSGSVTYLVETADPSRRGIAGSWANVGSLVGMLLGSASATVVTTVLSADAASAWGWRIPFVLGGVIGAFALWLRTNLPEESGREHDEAHREDSPLHEALTNDRMQTLKAVAFAGGYGVVFYLPLVYLPTYVSRRGNVPLDEALRVNTIATAALILVIPLAAMASDQWLRRRTLILVAFIGMAVASVPLFALMNGGGWPELLIAQTVFALLIAIPLGSAPAFFAEMFPREDRATGYSIAYNLGLGIVGGTAPMIATGLIDASGNDLAPAFYLLALAVVAILSVWTIRDRSREPLRSRSGEVEAPRATSARQRDRTVAAS